MRKVLNLTYTDERGAGHLVSFTVTQNGSAIDDCKYQLNKVFVKGTLWEVGEDGKRMIVGGIRECEPHEKKRKNHKWFRWVDLENPIAPPSQEKDYEENVDFMAELAKLSYSKAI